MASSEPGRRANPALYGGMPPARGPAGMAPRLLEFADELRTEGVAVGTSELLDAREVAGGPARARRAVRPLLLPGGRARGDRAGSPTGALPGWRGARPRRPARAHPRGDQGRLGRRDARPR